MNKEDKQHIINELKEKFLQSDFFYIADSSQLNVAQVNKLRRLCHSRGVEFRVAKNTLVKKALESANNDRYVSIYDVLRGPTALFFASNSSAPAKVIKEFRTASEKPVLKAAYIDLDIYVGDDQLERLASLKSKEELLGDLLGLLQSPMMNVISALQSGGNKITGILKTLEQRG